MQPVATGEPFFAWKVMPTIRRPETTAKGDRISFSNSRYNVGVLDKIPGDPLHWGIPDLAEVCE